MIKYGKNIIDNFFGFSYENQKLILNVLTTSLTEDDVRYKDSLESIFNPYINQLEELYELNDKGLKLKSYNIQKFIKDNSASFDYFFDAKRYTKEEDYKYMYFANCNAYDFNSIDFANKIFDVNYVEDEVQITNNFINEFKNAKYDNKINFIKALIYSYISVTFLPRDYIPGVNVLENEFDTFVYTAFGRTAYIKYSTLSPSRKINFLYRYKEDIENIYNKQLEESSKDNKSKRLFKRNARVKCCYR